MHNLARAGWHRFDPDDGKKITHSDNRRSLFTGCPFTLACALIYSHLVMPVESFVIWLQSIFFVDELYFLLLGCFSFVFVCFLKSTSSQLQSDRNRLDHIFRIKSNLISGEGDLFEGGILQKPEGKQKYIFVWIRLNNLQYAGSFVDIAQQNISHRCNIRAYTVSSPPLWHLYILSWV